MKRRAALFASLTLLMMTTRAQQRVGIGIDTPDASAVVDMYSTEKGMLFPSYDRHYDATVDDEASLHNNPQPADEGLTYYNTRSQALTYYGGQQWKQWTGFPAGAIAVWAGDPADLPEGWALCDGSNGRPDLRGRFVVGYGNHYTQIGETGGAETVALTVAQLPAHTHAVIDPGHQHTGTATHRHSYTLPQTQPIRVDPGNLTSRGPGQVALQTQEASYNPVISLSSRQSVSSIGHAGTGEPHENRPPYYVVAFIIKEN